MSINVVAYCVPRNRVIFGDNIRHIRMSILNIYRKSLSYFIYSLFSLRHARNSRGGLVKISACKGDVLQIHGGL